MWGTHQFFVEHIICRTSNSSIIPPTLPNQLQQIINARQDIVHEHDRIEHFILRVSQFMQRDERGVSHFGQILDTMIESASRPRRRSNHHAQPDRPTQSIKDPEESFRLVRRPVFVNRDKHILVPEHGRHAKEGGEQIRNDVERIVQIDREEVFVGVGLETPRARGDVIAFAPAGSQSQGIEP